LIDKTITTKYVYNIRIAGDFTAKHLPWYKHNKVYNVYENYKMCKKQMEGGISTTLRMITNYIENPDNFLKIHKNDEFFFIENNPENPNQNLSFWRDTYSTWENETFGVFDAFLHKDKVFIDIGGWIGTTCMYGSRKSKWVFSVEADTESYNDMKHNTQINCVSNYTLINHAIYNVDNIDVKFGKNKFLNNSKLNDSTSQIYDNDENDENEITHEYYLVKTITIDSLIQKNNINPHDISLIKVDIEGGEECILNELYNIHKLYKIPLYVSFHYGWWKDTNLNRFEFLTEEHKHMIYANPFVSILFRSKLEL
jgi:FkbM family methyltransferase